MATHSSVPDIPGIKADHKLAQMLRKEVADMLGRTSISFPGAQPVSFATKHLEELKRTDYYLCEKSDGIRCLLYFTRDGDKEVHYLIDRKNDYYWVRGLHFPLPNDETFRSFHTETLIDGELVLDNIDGGRTLKRYMVFDCLVLDNKRMMHRVLDKRLAYVMDYIYKPYKHLCNTFKEEVQYFPFEIEFKNMEFSYSIQYMFDGILPKLPHGNDGLIFTCRTTPYKFGTDEHIVKWKPVSENSIDFRLNLEFPFITPSDLDEDEGSDTESLIPDFDAMPTFHLSVYMGDDNYKKWAKMYVTPEQWEELKKMEQPLDDEIVECVMDEEKRWRYMRFRKDKKHGNHISTVNSVMESVHDAVGKEELIAAQEDIRAAWKLRAARVERGIEDGANNKRARKEGGNDGRVDKSGREGNDERVNKRVHDEEGSEEWINNKKARGEGDEERVNNKRAREEGRTEKRVNNKGARDGGSNGEEVNNRNACEEGANKEGAETNNKSAHEGDNGEWVDKSGRDEGQANNRRSLHEKGNEEQVGGEVKR